MNEIKKFVDEYGPGAGLIFLIAFIWFFAFLALIFEFDLFGIDFDYIEDFVFASCFIATIFLSIFAEILHFLYQNNKKQAEIIYRLKEIQNKSSDETKKSKSLIADIEENLPNL